MEKRWSETWHVLAKSIEFQRPIRFQKRFNTVVGCLALKGSLAVKHRRKKGPEDM